MKKLLSIIVLSFIFSTSNVFSADYKLTTCVNGASVIINVHDNKFEIVTAYADANGKEISQVILSGSSPFSAIEAKEEDIKSYQDVLKKGHLIDTDLKSGHSLLIESDKNYESYFYHTMVDGKDNVHAFIIPVKNPSLTYMGSVDACAN